MENTTTKPLTQRQADACLAKVKRQFKSYTEPFEGYKPLCPEPTIQRGWTDWYGHTWAGAILWEDGPSEWAHRAVLGGSSEEDRALVAMANEEFGGNVKCPEDEPVVFPADVEAHVYNDWILVFNRADD